MNPIEKLKISKLPPQLEKKLLEIASEFEKFNYSSYTLGSLEDQAKANGDTDFIDKLERVKQEYGFDYVPQHKARRLQKPFTDLLRSYINVKLPEETDFVVQVIDTKDSFIHDDKTRTCSFYYMLTDDTAVTSFYESNVPPILETTWLPSDVRKTFSITMQKSNWYSFDHSKIHSVNDVTKLRIGFIVDLTRAFSTYEECMKHFEGIVA